MKPYMPHRITVLSLTALLLMTNCKTTEAPVIGPVVDSMSGRHGASEERLSTAAATAIAAGRTEEALALYERRYAQNRIDRDVALNYAQLLRKTGKPQRALAVLAPYLDTRSRRRLQTKVDPIVWNEYAAAHIELGNFDPAKEALQRVLGDPQAANAHADAHHLQGIILDAEGHHKEAEQAFRSALQGWKGDSTSVMNNLALNLASQGLFDESLATLRQALVMAPQKQEIAQNIRMVTDLRKAVVPAPAPISLQK